MNKLRSLLCKPWTVEVEREDGAVVLTISELPEFFAAGSTPDEAESNFWEALESYLNSFLELGEEPPTPATGAAREIADVGPEPGRRSLAEDTPGPIFEHQAA